MWGLNPLLFKVNCGGGSAHQIVWWCATVRVSGKVSLSCSFQCGYFLVCSMCKSSPASFFFQKNLLGVQWSVPSVHGRRGSSGASCSMVLVLNPEITSNTS